MPRAFIRRVLPGVAIVVAFSTWAGAQAPAPIAQPSLTKEQMRAFLQTAKVTKSQSTGKGVTRPFRLTLTDGTTTHDALFQSIQERSPFKKFDRGKQELNFVDSYHYNIAAYDLAEMLGLDVMMPMSVERRWNGRNGSLTWWVEDVMMDEGERLKKAVRPPDPDGWNKQFYKMRVFSQLVYDTDRNLTNVLITKDWKVWMIDFTRAFRLWPDLPSPGDLNRIERQLLERLRELNVEGLEAKLGEHLSDAEVAAIITRRDKIVERFTQLTAERGEANVLF